MGENCRTACRTRDHDSFGECARAANITVAPVDVDGSRKANKQELDAYAAARADGIQPAGTRMHQTQAAVAVSNLEGKAWDASSDSFRG